MHIVLLLGEFGGRCFTHSHYHYCRNAKRMPTDVTEALKEVVMTQGHLSQLASDKLLRELESCKQLQFETWN